jgi:hypothetical protein
MKKGSRILYVSSHIEHMEDVSQPNDRYIGVTGVYQYRVARTVGTAACALVRTVGTARMCRCGTVATARIGRWRTVVTVVRARVW